MKRRKKNGRVLPVLISVFIFLIIFLVIKLNTKYWNGVDKFSFVFNNPNGDVGITVIDPQFSEITTLIIPSDTQVEVSQNYGTFRIKNVWQLGLNEKKDGILMAQTIRRNFLFPVFLWSFDGGKRTNIPFGDRLLVALYTKRVGSAKETTVDLGKSQFVHKEKLSDGKMGYVLSGQVSDRLASYFSDNTFPDNGIRVYITDSTGVFGVSQKVGQIVETMGGKIVSIERKTETSDIDCLVSGNNAKIATKIANIFNCKVVNAKSDFDMEIQLGSKFLGKF